MKLHVFIFVLMLRLAYPMDRFIFTEAESLSIIEKTNSSAGQKNTSVEAPSSPLKTASEMFNERGYYKSNGFSFDEQEIVNDFNGNLVYTFPLYNYALGGDLNLNMKLNYNSSLNHNIIVSSVQYQNNANLNRFNNRYTMNFPEWILEINGFAVQVFNFETNFFNKTGASSLSGSDVNAVIPGYHFDNELREVSASNKDVINIMSGDGSVISMQNDNYDSNNDWNNYIGNYSFKGKKLHYKAILSYKSPIVSGEYAGYKERNMILLTGDGLEYYFEEKIKNFEDYKSDSIVNARINPMMMFLSEIRDRFGRILHIGYTSYVPFSISGNEPIMGRDLFESVMFSGISSTIPVTGITAGYGQGGVKLFDESELNGNYTLNFERPVNYRPYGDNNIQRASISKILNILNQKTEFDYQIYGRRYTNAFNPFGTSSNSITLDLNDLRRISSVTNSLGLERTYTYLGSQTDEINLVTYLAGEDNRKFIMNDSGAYKGMGRDPFFTNMLTSKLEYTGSLKSTTGFSYLYDPGERTNVLEVPVDQSDVYESWKTITYNNRPVWDTTSDFRIERHYKVYPLYDSANHFAYSPDNDGLVRLIKEIIQDYDDYTALKTTDLTFEAGSFNSTVLGYNGSFFIKTKKESFPGVSQFNEWKWDYTYRGGNYDSLISETKETDPLNNYTISRDTSFMTRYWHKQFISDYTYNSALISSYFYKIQIPVNQIRYTAAEAASQKKTYEYIQDTSSAEGYYGQLISEKVYKFPSFNEYIETKYAYCKDDTTGRHLFAGTGIFPYKEGNLKLVKSNDKETRYYYNPVYLSEVYKNNDPNNEFPDGIPFLKYKIKFNDGSVLDTFALIWDHRLPVRIETDVIAAGEPKQLSVVYKTYTLDGNPSMMIDQNLYLTQIRYQPIHRINSITLPGDFSNEPDSTALEITPFEIYNELVIRGIVFGNYNDFDDTIRFANSEEHFYTNRCPIFKANVKLEGTGYTSYQSAYIKFDTNEVKQTLNFRTIDSAYLNIFPYSKSYIVNGIQTDNNVITNIKLIDKISALIEDYDCVNGGSTYENALKRTPGLLSGNDINGSGIITNNDYSLNRFDIKNLILYDRNFAGMLITPLLDLPPDQPPHELTVQFTGYNDINGKNYWEQNYTPNITVFGYLDISDTLKIPIIKGGTIKYSYDDDNHTTDVYNIRNSLNNDRSRIKYLISESGNVKQKDIYVSENSYNSYKYKFNYLNKPSVSFDALGDSTGMIYDGLERQTVIINSDTSRTLNTYGYTGNFANYFGTTPGVTFYQRFTDEEGNYFDKYTDAAGNLRREIKYIQEDPNLENLTYLITDYKYDSLYRVSQVKTPEGKFISYSYDGYGRKSKRITPDAGQMDYYYDKNNNIIFTQDENQRNVNVNKYTFKNYDGMNRITGRGEAVLEPDSPNDESQYQPSLPDEYLTVNVYDTLTSSIVNNLFNPPSDYYSSPNYTKGNMVSAAYRTRSSDSWNFKYYRYDERNRMIKMWILTAGFPAKAISYAYNSQDQITNVYYNTGADYKRYIYKFDFAGRLDTVNYYFGEEGTDVSSLYKNFTNYEYNENSLVQHQNYGGTFLTNSYLYNNRNWVTQLYNSISQFVFDNDYYKNGNVKSQYFYGSYRDNFVNTDDIYFTYSYDRSNRLTNVINEITQDNTYHLENTYDKDGNIKTLKRYGDTNTIKDNFNYEYNSGTNKLNNVNGSKDQFSYDYNGNLIDDKLNVNYGIKYDHRNLITEIYHKRGASPTRVTLYATRYFYDESGNRNRKLIYTNSNENAGPVLDWNNLSNPGNGWVFNQNEFYVRGVNGNELATYKDTTLVEWYVQGNGIEGKIKGTTGYYFYKDHLGSVRAIVSDNGDLVSAQDYDAWGYLLEGRIYDSDSTKFKFTSKERDEESKYDYSYSRNYNSRIGIFNSSEPIPSSSFGWGSFVYCANNPLRIIDPTGEEWYYIYDESGGGNWKFYKDESQKKLWTGKYDEGGKKIYEYIQGYKELLFFQGSELQWLMESGEIMGWEGVSGILDEFGRTQPNYQNIENVGPIPEGWWIVDPQNAYGVDKFEGPIDLLKWIGNFYSQGEAYINIYPTSDNSSNRISGFSIHGGMSPGSIGCIDLTSSMYQFYKTFVQHNKSMLLNVDYSKFMLP